HGQGMVALGTAWSVRADGPHRFAAAGAAFRSVAARARVDDEVRVRTSGLIALGSFSYADGSPRPSTLMVPRALLGVHDGESFLTVVGVDEEPAWPTSWRDLFPSSPVPAASAEPLDVAAAHTPDEYQALVTAADEEIRAGHAEKIVLSERTTGRTPVPLSRACSGRGWRVPIPAPGCTCWRTWWARARRCSPRPRRAGSSPACSRGPVRWPTTGSWTRPTGAPSAPIRRSWPSTPSPWTRWSIGWRGWRRSSRSRPSRSCCGCRAWSISPPTSRRG